MPKWLLYVSIAIVAYMIVLFVRGLIERTKPMRGEPIYPIYRALRAVTEPYLMIFRPLTSRFERGTIDWAIIIGITVLFIIVQVLRVVAN